MAHSAPARTKINTKATQPACGRAARPRPPAGPRKAGHPAKGPRVSGDTRESVRQSARVVIALECGITVYPPGTDGEPRRAVFTENGQRRYRQGATEAKLAAKLEKVAERLRADAPNMERPGADLIAHYLDPDRHHHDDRAQRLAVATPEARAYFRQDACQLSGGQRRAVVGASPDLADLMAEAMIKIAMGFEGGHERGAASPVLAAIFSGMTAELWQPPEPRSCPGCGGSQAVEQAGEPVIAGDVDAGVRYLVVHHDGGAVGAGLHPTLIR
jgi:hypothetical protein